MTRKAREVKGREKKEKNTESSKSKTADLSYEPKEAKPKHEAGRGG